MINNKRLRSGKSREAEASEERRRCSIVHRLEFFSEKNTSGLPTASGKRRHGVHLETANEGVTKMAIAGKNKKCRDTSFLTLFVFWL